MDKLGPKQLRVPLCVPVCPSIVASLLVFLRQSPEVHTMWVRKYNVCNPFPKLSDMQMHYNPPRRQLHSDFGDFNNGVCHVLKITVVESNPDMGLLTKQTVCFSPDLLATANTTSTMTTSVVSNRVLLVLVSVVGWRADRHNYIVSTMFFFLNFFSKSCGLCTLFVHCPIIQLSVGS